MPRADWLSWATELAVPVYEGLELPATVDEAVAQADGIRSLASPERPAEGIVWHHARGAFVAGLDLPCFKVLSNKYLLKHG